MNIIFYGVNGEGLGHASRAMSVIEHLKDSEVHIFTYGQAYDYFKNNSYPYLYKIDGVRFSYKNGKIDYCQSIKNALAFYFLKLNKNISKIKKLANILKPNLYITDLEPSISRSADKNKLVSIDNQHRFAYSDMLKLSFKLKIYGWCVGLLAKWVAPNPKYTIISTFHWDNIKVKKRNVILTNGFLRKNIEATEPTKGDYILVYLRSSVREKILDSIENLPYNFVVFGAGEEVKSSLLQKENFKFLPLSDSFVDYLANCKFIISTAGNQLLTEARFWKKPFMAIPEPGQYEQVINANYCSLLNMGKMYELESFDGEDVKLFDNFCDNFYYVSKNMPNGVHKAIKIIEKMNHE